MHSFEVKRLIHAPSERVWAILTDSQRLVRGRLGITRIDGTIEPGGRLKLWSEAAPGRAFALFVTIWEPPERMTWVGGMPFGLFRGVRDFTLTEVAEGVNFQMREIYSGLMAGLIWKSMPDLTPQFEKFALGLQALSETPSE